MVNNVTKLWDDCLAIIKDNLPAEQFNAWFSPIVAISFEDNKLILKVPTQFFIDYIEETYPALLTYTLKRVFGDKVRLAYKYDVVSNVPDTEVTIKNDNISARLKTNLATQPTQISNPFAPVQYDDIDPQLNLRYTFENYCGSMSNKLAVSIGMAIATNPDCKTYNPMFIFGSTGVGKTHLIQAIGIKIKETNPRARVLYLTARVFESQYTSAVKQNKVNDFINFYQSIDVLLLDDIQEFAGKVSTQNTFFHIFNHLHQHQKQLIMTSDCRPSEMDGMVPRLISRFKWGMTVELSKPDYELRREVLAMKAAQDGLSIPDEVLDYIATNVTESVRELEGIVVSLLAHATMLNQEITVDLAKTVISNSVHINKRQVTFELIAEVVANHYNIDTEQLYGKSRKREISDARQLLMYFAKKETQLSSTNIGLRLSRNHATVLHACKQIEQRMSVEKEFRQEVADMAASLK
ncbi:MAG: chromosomal replication initiator protein DnaA [Muribaculaceae bacterium]|nr:chromosomal replication initiator protein DnaA [Muribaculaceae bacterium]